MYLGGWSFLQGNLVTHLKSVMLKKTQFCGKLTTLQVAYLLFHCTEKFLAQYLKQHYIFIIMLWYQMDEVF